MFGAVSEENVARIKRQNERKISVIIGNPPYNANIDKRIKRTTLSLAAPRRPNVMISRFFRWASDQIDDDGIVAFVSNRNFIDAFEANEFRKCLAEDF